MRRAFFSKRAFWVYGLALFPALIFFGHGLQVKLRRDHLSAHGMVSAAAIDSVAKGQNDEEVLKRVGRPAEDVKWTSRRRIRQNGAASITTHSINATTARFVRLNILTPSQSGDPAARVYEFEVYGPAAARNLALRRPAIGSLPCDSSEGPEKAFNGSVSGGSGDKWCSREDDKFLQVDLGAPVLVNRFVVKHAGAGKESEERNARDFNIQVSTDGKNLATVVKVAGGKQMWEEKRTSERMLVFFDGRREARFWFKDGVLTGQSVHPLLSFEEDRRIFAGIFQFFYLRLAIFFGCLGIFMNLFRGEMLDKTLHFWFLAPARREVLLVGKYAAGLAAAAVIFTGGALLCFGALLWPHDPAEVQAYWQGPGLAHAFWYAAAAALGCVGYGSVFLAAGLLLRNPIIPAAVLLIWESINGFLPAMLQKLSVLYYLQSLCPVPAPMDEGAPALVRLLLAPAEPASRLGSVVGLLVVTALVLWAAAWAVRRMQISYGTE